MLPLVCNLPMICLLLSMTVGILTALVRNGRRAFFLTAALLVAVTAASAAVLVYTWNTGESFTYTLGLYPTPVGIELRAGVLEGLLATCFPVVMLLSILGGYRDICQDVPAGKQSYYFLMLDLLLATLLGLIYTNDLFTAFVFLEVSTIAGSCIILSRETGETILASIRYIIFSTLGSGVFLLGLAILYQCTGHLHMDTLHTMIQLHQRRGEYLLPLMMSFGLLLAGLAFRSALFPFHGWLPGSRGSSTTASSALLSSLFLKGFAVMTLKVILRVFSLESAAEYRITDMLFLLGLVGMVFGSVRALIQKDAKRMAAYSTVAQMGYVYLGIGLGSAVGIAAAVYHILVHAFTKAMLFTSIGALSGTAHHSKRWADLRGSGRARPLAGAAFTLAALSLCGVPVLAGFGGKYVLSAAAFGVPGRTAVTLAVLVVSALLNALYFLPAVINIWSPSERVETVPRDGCYGVSALCFLGCNLVLGVGFVPLTRLIETGISMF